MLHFVQQGVLSGGRQGRPLEHIGTPQIGSNNGSADIVLTFDVPPEPDDLVVILGGYRGGTGGSQGATGYTNYYDYTASSYSYCVATKRMGATPDTDVTCLVGSGSFRQACYAAYVFRGVHPDIWDASYVETDAGSGAPNAGPITTASPLALVMAAGFSSIEDTSVTVPSGYGNHVQTARPSPNPFTLAVATLTKAVPGAEDPPIWTDFDSAVWRAVTLALKPE
jgi:hypothetical protein